MKKKIWAVILFICIISGSLQGCSNHKKDIQDNAKTVIKDIPEHIMFDTENGEYAVDDEGSALAVIEDVGKKYEIKNISNNLSECKENNIDNSTYYSFAQTYKDIPVYGRKVIVNVDENNNLRRMNSNYISLEKLSIKEKISEQEANEIVQKRYEEPVVISTGDKAIYSLYGTEPVLTWEFYITGAGISENCFVDAQTGEIVETFSNIYAESEKGIYKDEKDTVEFNVKRNEDNSYSLIDEERNIQVFDAKNKMTNYAMMDDRGNIYYCDIDTTKDKWYDRPINKKNKIEVEIHYQESTRNWTIVDKKSDRVLGKNAEYIFYTNNPKKPLRVINSKSNTWDNGRAARAFALTEKTYDFWNNVLGRKGYDNNNGLVDVIVNDAWDNGNNMYSSLGEQKPPTVLAVGYNQIISVGGIGHEYAHSVERTISNLNHQYESGSISEALGDVFGELLEDWITDGKLNDSCDWINGSRNMVSPSKGKRACPDTYHGKNYWYSKRDDGGTHTNCTVISHACYLMTHTEKGISIENEELANLLYRTLGDLLPNCDFDSFATAVYNNACDMQLGKKKIKAIKAAFEKVGLTIDADTIVVKIDENNESKKAEYSWVVKPTIEADDIYYMADYPDVEHSINELSKQADNPNAVIRRGDKLGIIDLDGQLLTEVEYTEIANFGSQYMLIKENQNYDEYNLWWIDENGTIIDTEGVGNGDMNLTVYYYYGGARQRTGNTSAEFVQDAIPVQQATEYAGMSDSVKAWNSLTGKYALEKDCNLITDFIYDECGSISDGLCAVCQNGKWGYIDEKGQVVIPIEHDASWEEYPVFALGSKRSSSKVKDYCYGASEGYVVLCQDGKWKLCDTSGQVKIPFGELEEIRPVFDGKCWAKKDGKWGVLEVAGNDLPANRSEKDLLQILESTSGNTMETYKYVDMDHDGNNEIIGAFSNNGQYQFWYCSSDGETCKLIHTDKDKMEACDLKLLEMDNVTHVAANTYRTMGNVKEFSILALDNNDVKCVEEDTYGYVSMNEEGDITLNVGVYDSMYDSTVGNTTGRTSKDTYIYYDNGAYKEYGATPIQEAEFLNFENAKEIKDKVASKMSSILSDNNLEAGQLVYQYYTRKNGIMHIECDYHMENGSIYYGYFTTKYKDNHIEDSLSEYTPGKMEEAFSQLEEVY